MHILVKIGGEEKLRGEERLNYLSTCLHCFPLIFSKIFSLATLARLHFIFIPNQGTRNIYGRDGKVRLAFKSGNYVENKIISRKSVVSGLCLLVGSLTCQHLNVSV